MRWVQRRVDLNEYKRAQAVPGLKVTSRAFGSGPAHARGAAFRGVESRRTIRGGCKTPRGAGRVRTLMPLETYLQERLQLIDRALDGYLPRASAKPPTVHKAMRYSLFAGGKRIRPVLALAAAEACGGAFEAALPAACAVECIHTYSLVHDDLPCMDDDDLRRGRPTSHKVFGEGIAVLAGDALLTVAFEILAQAQPTARYSVAQLITELAHAAGSRWLIGGQVADLENEGRTVTAAELRYIHRCKTAALLTSSLRLGGDERKRHAASARESDRISAKRSDSPFR